MSQGNVLSFSLGLGTSSFISAITSARGALAGFIGGMLSVGSIIHNVNQAIERGGGLADLSAQTRETVANLYSLDVAFEVAGAGAGAAGASVTKLAKSMSGVTDNGEGTKAIFKAIGLDFDKLQKSSAPQRIIAIAEALRKLPADQAAGIAAKIFGREGANNILRIAGDLEGFKDALKQSADSAAVFGRNAAAFDKIGDTLTLIRSRVQGLWAGVAEGVAPAIQQIEDSLNKIDFVGIGQKFGQIISAFTQSFRDGTITDLIAISIVSGLRAANDVAPAVAAQIGLTMFKVLQRLMRPALRQLTGLSDQEFDELDEGPNKAVNKMLGLALNRAHADLGPLNDRLNRYSATAFKNATSPGGGTAAALADAPRMSKGPVPDLERIGFMFNGQGGSPIQNSLRAIEKNTWQIANDRAQKKVIFVEGPAPAVWFENSYQS